MFDLKKSFATVTNMSSCAGIQKNILAARKFTIQISGMDRVLENSYRNLGVWFKVCDIQEKSVGLSWGMKKLKKNLGVSRVVG